MPLMDVRRRHGWLVPIAGLHLALLVCWRFTAPPSMPQLAQREGELVFLAHMPSRQQKAEEPRLPIAAQQARRRAVPPAMPASNAAPPADNPPPPAQQPETIAPNPLAQPAPAMESLLERSRRAAIGVDRQLRKESKNDNDRVLVRESKLSQDIALAYKGSGAFSMVETVLPNGDSLARVTTPFTSYCLLKRGNRGLNAIDDAGKTLIVTCPK
ncbi:hypothetical protein [Pseudoduganella violaceinigra]|uniref:hypothetical protein n=1 Tax=Pseudoduganella violaceinigra TaxID=246602 RepID=UPI0012B6123E|nr:hypothetical protein [Pseudoduganella violaceinigra]